MKKALKDKYGYLTLQETDLSAAEKNTELIYTNFTAPAVKYSIVIPTYRRPGIIRQTMLSALTQTCSFPYEVLITSDGSFPEELETEAIVRSLGEEYPNISYYRNAQNVGMFDNWNVCISKAKGAWVVILPDDDMLAPDYLRVLDAFLTRHNSVGMVGVKSRSVQGKLPYSDVSFPAPPETLTAKYIGKTDLYFGGGINVTGMAFSKESIRKLGGFQPLFFPVADSVTMAKFACYLELVNLECVLSAYRVDDNISLSEKVMQQVVLYSIKIRETMAQNHFVWRLHYKLFENSVIRECIAGAQNFWNVSINTDEIMQTLEKTGKSSPVEKAAYRIVSKLLGLFRKPKQRKIKL